MSKSKFGVIGLGVMGKSISLNIAEKGIALSVFNRIEEGESDVVSNFLNDSSEFKNIEGHTDLSSFVQSLNSPKKILLMIPAGKAIDQVIEQITPILSEGDIIIDGGNSHYSDTKRRFDLLLQSGISFVGCGISGGEEGARKGPAIMPGGSQESYEQLSPILDLIAAKDANSNPCSAYIGPGGSGHFIKMVHNGIEYAEMQLLAELYALLSISCNNEKIADIFSQWQQKDLSSYLLEITIDILRKKEGDQYLLDNILDKAENKGTGSWSSKTALDLGIPNTMMTSAVFARYISSFKARRAELSKVVNAAFLNEKPIDIDSLERAYRFARIMNHQQGFNLMKIASEEYDWNLNLTEIARIWTNGCIIRSDFMVESVDILQNHNELIDDINILNQIDEFAVIDLIKLGMDNRVACDTIWSSYNYWVAMTTENLPANLIQAQRDYFGAHTYQRKDNSSGEFFHTNWK